MSSPQSKPVGKQWEEHIQHKKEQQEAESARNQRSWRKEAFRANIPDPGSQYASPLLTPPITPTVSDWQEGKIAISRSLTSDSSDSQGSEAVSNSLNRSNGAANAANEDVHQDSAHPEPHSFTSPPAPPNEEIAHLQTELHRLKENLDNVRQAQEDTVLKLEQLKSQNAQNNTPNAGLIARVEQLKIVLQGYRSDKLRLRNDITEIESRQKRLRAQVKALKHRSNRQGRQMRRNKRIVVTFDDTSPLLCLIC